MQSPMFMFTFKAHIQVQSPMSVADLEGVHWVPWNPPFGVFEVYQQAELYWLQTTTHKLFYLSANLR